MLGVENGGRADEAGVQPGDVIVSVNRKDVSQVEELNAAVAATSKESGAVLLLLYRKGNLFFRAIDMVEKPTK